MEIDYKKREILYRSFNGLRQVLTNPENDPGLERYRFVCPHCGSKNFTLYYLANWTVRVDRVRSKFAGDFCTYISKSDDGPDYEDIDDDRVRCCGCDKEYGIHELD